MYAPLGGTANVGFNIVLTALLNVSFNSGAYMVVEGSRNAERVLNNLRLQLL
jgi:hypothetical protein